MKFKTKSERNEFYNKVFEYCQSVDWVWDELEAYAISLGIPIDEMIRDVKKYAEEYLRRPNYLAIVRWLEIQKKFTFLKTGVANPVLIEQKGITIYKLWENRESRKIVLEYIYNLWQNIDVDDQEIAVLFGISDKDIPSLLKIYAREFLKLSFSMWNEIYIDVNSKKRARRTGGSRVNSVLLSLLKTSDINEIVSIIESCGYDVSYLRSSVHDYLIMHEREHYEEYKVLLTNVFDLYSEYKSKQRQDDRDRKWAEYVEKTLPSAIKLIEMFIDSDCTTIKDFLDESGIVGTPKLNGEQIFKRSLALVKEFKVDLYQRYIEKIENERSRKYAIFAKQIKRMIYLLKYGIKENDIERKFDLIDYFQNFRVRFDTVLSFANELLKNNDISLYEYKLLRKFINYNKDYEANSDTGIQHFFSEKHEFNFEIDSNGNFVPGTGEIVTDEVKNMLIKYLRENNVPVNYRTCSMALARYMKGLLELENPKKY